MSEPVIQLPADAYLHPDAANEWWWHTGTLQAGERRFGFEINAAGFRHANGPLPPVCFTEMMLSDPQTQTHYQNTSQYPYDPAWAESDPSQPWYARMGDLQSDNWVSMSSQGDIWTLWVAASFTDAGTGQQVTFNLRLSQHGKPLLVWGTGEDPAHTNFYYSFTNLQVEGTISIAGEVIAVTGVTWMDHQYGVFAATTQWVLQDAQLDNGVCLSSSAVGPLTLVNGGPVPRAYTSMLRDGVSTVVETSITPSNPWLEGGPTTYYLTWDVTLTWGDVLAPRVNLRFEALMSDQLFRTSPISVYEGAATVTGTFDGLPVTGTAWLEQALG